MDLVLLLHCIIILARVVYHRPSQITYNSVYNLFIIIHLLSSYFFLFPPSTYSVEAIIRIHCPIT